MRAPALAGLALAVACVPDADDRRALDLRIPTMLPDGRVTQIAMSPLPGSAAASPESLRRYMEVVYWPRGTHAQIASRHNISYGFATTTVRPGMRETHVVRQVGTGWSRCSAGPIVDAQMETAVVAYCQAHALQR